MKNSFFKKVALSALALTLTFSLAACGNTQNAGDAAQSGTDTAANTSAEGTTIKVGARRKHHTSLRDP